MKTEHKFVYFLSEENDETKEISQIVILPSEPTDEELVDLVLDWVKKMGFDNKKLAYFGWSYYEDEKFESYQDLSERLDNLKDLAVELQLPILTAGQINKTPYDTKN